MTERPSAARSAVSLLLLAAGCGLFRETPNSEIRVVDGDSAEVDLPATREAAHETVIATLRHLGAPDVSSLEGGWVTGQIGPWRVHADLAPNADGTTRLRVRVRDVANQKSNLEMAQRVAGDVLRRAR